MILHYKDITINEDNISFKKKIHLSKDFSFIPIQYNNNDFMIQTPKLYSPFTIKQYPNNKKKYLNLSFQDLKDHSTKNFIEKCLHIFYKKTEKNYSKNYHIEKFIKQNEYSKWMRFKVPDYCQFYDQNKSIINDFPDRVLGSFIIHLSGLWILNNTIIFNWNIIQGKINLPIKLKEFLIIEEEEKPHKPPPPPPRCTPPPPPPPPPPLNKYDKMIKIGIPQKAVNQKKSIDRAIKVSDLKNVKLKKINDENDKKNIINDSFLPSLNEIRIALKSLKIVNL
tara:strand:+ start:397 stop:1236 length:840 start_codon:yes stop_codon:yes gene_type:complete